MNCITRTCLLAAFTLLAAFSVTQAAPFERVFEPTGPDAINRSTGQFVGLAEANGVLFAGGLYSQVTNDGSGNVTVNSTILVSLDGGNTWPERVEQDGNETLYAFTAAGTNVVGAGTVINPGSTTFPGVSLVVNAEGEPTVSQFTLDANANLRGLAVAYGDGVYVYGSTNGTLLRSTDGIDWAEVEWELSGVVGRDISNLFWDGSRFILFVGTAIYTSPFGVEWTLVVDDLNPVVSLTDIAYDGSRYVAVGSGFQSGFAVTSTNLENWTSGSPEFSQAVTDVAYGNGYFVATTGGFGASPLLYYSQDGQNWTEFDTGIGELSLDAVAFLNNTWFISAHSNTSAFNPGIYKATEEFVPQQGSEPGPDPVDGNPWANTFPAGPNVYFDSNLGFFFFNDSGDLWTYNYLLGWMYPVGDYDPGLWMYVISLEGWMYANADFNGFTYRQNEDRWYYYDTALDTFFAGQ